MTLEDLEDDINQVRNEVQRLDQKVDNVQRLLMQIKALLESQGQPK